MTADGLTGADYAEIRGPEWYEDDEAVHPWDLYEDEDDAGDEPDICPECGGRAFLDEGWYICPECGLGWNSEPPF